MAFYPKFGKARKDLLTKGFIDDKEEKQERRRIEFNGKAKSGVEVTFEGVTKFDDSSDGKLKVKRSCSRFDVDNEFEFSKDNVKVVVTDDKKHVDGLKAVFTIEGAPSSIHKCPLFGKKDGEGSAPADDGEEAATKGSECQFGASAEFEYSTSVNDDIDFAGAIKFSHEKKDKSNLVDFSLALSHSCGGSFGGSFKAPLNDVTAFKEASVGGRYSESDLTIDGGLTFSKEKSGDLGYYGSIGAIHKYNDCTSWGAEATVPIKGSKQWEVRGVLARTCGDEAFKLRLAYPSGRVAGAYSTKFGAHTDVSVAVESNLVNIFEGKAADHKISSKVSFNAK